MHLPKVIGELPVQINSQEVTNQTLAVGGINIALTPVVGKYSLAFRNFMLAVSLLFGRGGEFIPKRQLDTTGFQDNCTELDRNMMPPGEEAMFNAYLLIPELASFFSLNDVDLNEAEFVVMVRAVWNQFPDATFMQQVQGSRTFTLEDLPVEADGEFCIPGFADALENGGLERLNDFGQELGTILTAGEEGVQVETSSQTEQPILERDELSYREKVERIPIIGKILIDYADYADSSPLGNLGNAIIGGSLIALISSWYMKLREGGNTTRRSPVRIDRMTDVYGEEWLNDGRGWIRRYTDPAWDNRGFFVTKDKLTGDLYFRYSEYDDWELW